MNSQEIHHHDQTLEVSMPEAGNESRFVDPVDVLRVATAQARSPTEWARSHGMSPSYVRQALGGSRGFGRKLLEALHIDQVVVFRMSTDDGSPPAQRCRPEIAGYAIRSNNDVWSVGVNEAAAWIGVLGWDDPDQEGTAMFDGMTCQPCSRRLFDQVNDFGAVFDIIEIEGVLCLSAEVAHV